jgi:hypothetical protein
MDENLCHLHWFVVQNFSVRHFKWPNERHGHYLSLSIVLNQQHQNLHLHHHDPLLLHDKSIHRRHQVFLDIHLRHSLEFNLNPKHKHKPNPDPQCHNIL